MTSTHDYEKKTQREQILHRPDMYVGATKPLQWDKPEWVATSLSPPEVALRPVTASDGLMRIWIEPFSNAKDSVFRSNMPPARAARGSRAAAGAASAGAAAPRARKPRASKARATYIRVAYDPKTFRFTIENDGFGIPLEVHPESQPPTLVPVMVFSQYSTSSNYDDTQDRVTSGRNGYGSKLTNTFSTEFSVETWTCSMTLKGHPWQRYQHTWRNNMTVSESPRGVEALPAESKPAACEPGYGVVRVSWTPDFARFGRAAEQGYLADELCYLNKLVLDCAMEMSRFGVSLYFNDTPIRVSSLLELARVYVPLPAEERAAGQAAEAGDAANDADDADDEDDASASESEAEPADGEEPPPAERTPLWKQYVRASSTDCDVVLLPLPAERAKEGLHMSYVNGICTSDGGVHVQEWEKALLQPLAKKLKLEVRDIRKHFALFVNAFHVNQPKFHSQNKTKLIEPAVHVKVKKTVPRELMKWSVVAEVLSEQLRRDRHQLNKLSSGNAASVAAKIKELKVSYEEANFARLSAKRSECLSEDSRVLTSAGFLFLSEVLTATDDGKNLSRLLFACYNDTASHLEYHPASHLLVKPSGGHDMVSLVHHQEEPAWSSSADCYGRTALKTADSNHVSLLVSDNHDMFVQHGKQHSNGLNKSPSIHWLDRTTDGVRSAIPFSKTRLLPDGTEQRNQASTLLNDDPRAAVRLLSVAFNGVKPLHASHAMGLPFVEPLGLSDGAQVDAFLELYGFWLGDGSLTHKPTLVPSGCLTFEQYKEVDRSWLRGQFSKLGLKAPSAQVAYTVVDQRWYSYFASQYGHRFKLPGADARFDAAIQDKSEKGFWPWVLTHLDRRQVRLVLEGFRRADGCWKANKKRFYTSSVKVRDELVIACLHAGYSAYSALGYVKGTVRGYKWHDQKVDNKMYTVSHVQSLPVEQRSTFIGVIANHDAWEVRYAEPDTTPSGASACMPTLYCQRDIKRVEAYSGRVWCPTVPFGLIVAQRASVDARGVVVKQSRPCIVGNCVLVGTEGIGARAWVMNSLNAPPPAHLLCKPTKDRVGIMAFRGKSLNVSNTTTRQLLANKEWQGLIVILGLKTDVDYRKREHRRSLRYGKFLMIADADLDGYHIVSLMFNFFAVLYPTLLQNTEEPFFYFLRTPIITLRLPGKNATEKHLYSWTHATSFVDQLQRRVLSESLQQRFSRAKVLYRKGLGVWGPKEPKDEAGRRAVHLYLATPAELPRFTDGSQDAAVASAAPDPPRSGEAAQAQAAALADALEDTRKFMDHIFLSENSGFRKEWLTRHFAQRVQDEGKLVSDDDPTAVAPDFQPSQMPVRQYLNEELSLFSAANCGRSLPLLDDGLKESQRKILFAAFLKPIPYTMADPIKLSQFAGFVAEKTEYHYGEDNLNKTAIRMAQDYVGSNNIPLLYPEGNFGSRDDNGDDAAAPRYIHTKLSAFARLLFRAEDEPYLPDVYEDGHKVEKQYYLPVLPMLLVNGKGGIATAWSTKIPKYNPVDLANWIRVWLQRAELGAGPLAPPEYPALVPWIRGFTGKVVPAPETPGRFVVWGRIERVPAPNLLSKEHACVRVRDIPLGQRSVSIQKYRRMLEDMRLKGHIEFLDHSDGSTIDFKVQLRMHLNLDILSDEDLMRVLKLRDTIQTTNMVCMVAPLPGADGAPSSRVNSIRHFRTPEEMLELFCAKRLQLFETVRVGQIEELKRELVVADNRRRFIFAVVNKELVLTDYEDQALSVELERRGFAVVDDSHEYLLELRVRAMTKTRIAKLEDEIVQLNQRLAALRATTDRRIWLQCLEDWEKAWDKWLAEEAAANAALEARVEAGKKPKAAPRRRAAAK